MYSVQLSIGMGVYGRKRPMFVTPDSLFPHRRKIEFVVMDKATVKVKTSLLKTYNIVFRGGQFTNGSFKGVVEHDINSLSGIKIHWSGGGDSVVSIPPYKITSFIF